MALTGPTKLALAQQANALAYNPLTASSLLTLGDYTFGITTASYNSLTRSNSWNWAKNDILDGKPLHQYTGEGEETIRLEGVIYPFMATDRSVLGQLRGEVIGRVSNTAGELVRNVPIMQDIANDLITPLFARENKALLQMDMLRKMASAVDGGSPKSHRLTTGSGVFLGNYIITRISEKQGTLDQQGSPMRVGFTIELKKYNVYVEPITEDTTQTKTIADVVKDKFKKIEQATNDILSGAINR